MRTKAEVYIRKNWVWLLVNIAVFGAMLWLAMLVWNAPDSTQLALFDSTLARQPVLFSGNAALILLLGSLACTPLATIFGWRKTITVRKSLGLWAVGFALFHALYLIGNKAIFYDLEAWENIWRTTQQAFAQNRWMKMPYARAGVFALTALIPLALTSNRWSMRLLKKNWKRLHRLVYLAALLVVWHYAWRVYHMHKWGTPLNDSDVIGWWRPVLVAAIVAILLLVRLPKVRKWSWDR